MTGLRTCLLLMLATVVGAVPLRAEESPQLQLPVGCEMRKACVVQHYVDMDPGPGALDHTCGSLAYEAHNGIDIRTLTYEQMRTGVDVVAAAPGKVLRTRDRMADISVTEIGVEAVKGREAGNSVIIDHGGGWETQYSHLKRSSVAVRPGDEVRSGDVIGQIGLSGKTAFPHLHFTVRRDGKVLDPFTSLPPGSGCGKSLGSLWATETAAALAYQAGGLLISGFAAEPPGYPAVLEHPPEDELTRESPALIAWMVAWGPRQGDRWQMRVTGPDGQVVVENGGVQHKHQDQHFWYIGRKRPSQGWPAGVYQAEFKLQRPSAGTALEVFAHRQSIEIP